MNQKTNDTFLQLISTSKKANILEANYLIKKGSTFGP